MRDSKKAITVTLIFIVLVIIISAIPVGANIFYNSDRILRDELAGSIDYVVIGASHGLCAFVPEIIDEQLDCCSYNLCGSLITFNGRKALIEEEIERNSIKTLVIELSYNTFVRETYDNEGNMYVVPRLSGLKSKLKYGFENLKFDGIDWVYSSYLLSGLQKCARFSYLLYKNADNIGNVIDIYVDDANDDQSKAYKGFMARTVDNATIDSGSVKGEYNSVSINRNYNQENIEVLDDIVSMAKEKNIEVIFAVTPLADAEIWRNDNWDDFYSDIKGICEAYECPLFDFNLMKSRYALLSDDVSFWGNSHLCKAGAEVFTAEYCRIMNKYNSGEDITEEFYNSYDEMKADSPYWNYMN